MRGGKSAKIEKEDEKWRKIQMIARRYVRSGNTRDWGSAARTLASAARAQ